MESGSVVDDFGIRRQMLEPMRCKLEAWAHARDMRALLRQLRDRH